MADAHAGHVGDRVGGARRQVADPEAVLPEAQVAHTADPSVI